MKVAAAHQLWSSRFTFLMAAIGSAVGLGNIWKFPYVAGVNGGGAFVLVYLAAVILIAIPILMGELAIGRHGKLSPPNAMGKLAEEAGVRPTWRVVGWLGMLSAFLVLTFYSVIAGWALDFIPKLATGLFAGIDSAGVNSVFESLLGDPVRLIVWHTVFMAATVYVVGRGVHGGIEKAVNIMMPALFVMLLVMVGYAAYAGDFARGFEFLFAPDFSKLSPEAILMAVGQAFFSIGVAIGAMMAYGAYLPQNVNIPKAAVIIAGADTLVALLAGLAIFPIVFANGLDPAGGEGLIFVTLPLAFGAMPGGAFFGTLFFVLILFAAITSSISILEPAVSWVEERFRITRGAAALATGFLAWLIGLATVFSLNSWAGFFPLGFVERFADKTIFGLIDYITSNVMLPLGALFISLFVGWRMSRKALRAEFEHLGEHWYGAWLVVVRYVAPVVIVIVFVFNIFS